MIVSITEKRELMFSTWDSSAMNVLGKSPDLSIIHKNPHTSHKVIMKSHGFHVAPMDKETIDIVCDASDTVIGFNTPEGPIVSNVAKKQRRRLNHKELEAIRRALMWCFENHPDKNIQIWTDSANNAQYAMKDSAVLIKMIAEHWAHTRSHVGIQNIPCTSHSKEYGPNHRHFSVVQHWALDKVLRAANRGRSIIEEHHAMNILNGGSNP